MIKKWLALFLVLALLAPSCLAFAEEETDLPPELPDHLTVGNTTPMRGGFFTGMWSRDTADVDVRDLLHGYNLIRWVGEDAVFRTDPSVVSGVAVTENDAGDRTYLFALQRDLLYSDGSPVTAWDYAFSILLRISPLIEELGGVPEPMDYILGSEAYRSSRVPVLSGVRVLGDYSLSITLDHEALPFFFEMGLLSCVPYPIAEIAPGVQVKDDGDGVYLANEDETLQEPVFTAELLRRTILDAQTGYASHPRVVSGPYTLTRWEGDTAEFALNPYYKGNADGEKPTIATLTYTATTNDTMIDSLRSGELGLVNKVTRADVIQDGIGLMTEGSHRMSSYPRSGLSYLSFFCEKPALASGKVRQAIAWCLDRDAFAMEYTGNFGIRTDGYYGVGQWMVGIVNGTITPEVTPPENPNDAEAVAEYEAELEAWEELNLDALTVYTLDVERARALLEEDGWVLNDEGVREKSIDGETVQLDLLLFCPEVNNTAEIFEALLVPNLAEAGIRLRIETVPMEEIFRTAYDPGEREADMIFLASNFDEIFTPSSYFVQAEGDAPSWAFSRQEDAELFDLAVAMQKTEPGEVLEYVQRWIAFQERFNETLPMLPLYSNIYFDFYVTELQHYTIAENSTWSQAIVGAYFGLDEPEEEAETAESADDGTVGID